jgi:hypothetical protein
MFICKFCGKVCKNKNSLMNHSRLCKNNPDKEYSIFREPEFKRKKREKGCENQYTKAKRLGLPKPEMSEVARKKLSNNIKKRSKEWNKKNGVKISITVNQKVKNGEWHTSLAKHMHIDYNGIDLHGTWEFKYVQYLDANQIKWIRCKENFEYTYENKVRKYTPDFYLPETDTYIEIKCYKTNKDVAKWSQFPLYRKLKILMKKELNELGINVK